MMTFKEEVKNYLESENISVGKIEQEGDVKSIVCHILPGDNQRVEEIKEEMERKLDVVVMLSQMYGMNVVIIESNHLEE